MGCFILQNLKARCEIRLDNMANRQELLIRRGAVKKIVFSSGLFSAWSLPVVQAITLPVHAQMSSCTPGAMDDIPGQWQLEVFGAAAAISNLIFYEDGTVDHSFVNAWQYSGSEFRMTQGTRWVFTGVYTGCETLSGTYVNVFTIPVLGNVVVRRGNWLASKG